MNIISALKQVEIYYHLYLHERFTLDRNSLYLAYFNANVFIWFQLVAAISVSTGCLSYGICMAYTSSAIPSMLSPNVTSPLAIESSSDMNEMLAYSSWMSKLPRKFRTFSEYLYQLRGYDAPTSVKKPFLNYRQFLGVGSLVWVPFGCLSNGCHRTESNSSCLFSNESFHWLDTYDGCISNMAIVHRPFPSWPWHRLRNSNMPGLYF